MEEKTEQWAIVEMFGHQKVTGMVSEVQFGGCAFVRVDVPGNDDNPGFTKYLGQGAIYCINFVTEGIARSAAKYHAAQPVQSYELPQIGAPHRDADEEWS